MAVTIAARLAAVRERIAQAARDAGRDPKDVMLVAVSKRHSAAAVCEAYAAGQRVFGENYVQEMVGKHGALADCPELRWHFIGHLQRNKARQVIETRAWLETLDSVRLADALSKALAKRPGAEPLDVSVQVNVSGEAQKSGVAPSELSEVLTAVRALPQLRLRGLMTVPPADPDPERARAHFARLAELGREHDVAGLSMGMSADLEVAVAEGATVVRVGTAIFGPRPLS